MIAKDISTKKHIQKAMPLIGAGNGGEFRRADARRVASVLNLGVY
jgi:hypothetical protein